MIQDETNWHLRYTSLTFKLHRKWNQLTFSNMSRCEYSNFHLVSVTWRSLWMYFRFRLQVIHILDSWDLHSRIRCSGRCAVFQYGSDWVVILRFHAFFPVLTLETQASLLKVWLSKLPTSKTNISAWLFFSMLNNTHTLCQLWSSQLVITLTSRTALILRHLSQTCNLWLCSCQFMRFDGNTYFFPSCCWYLVNETILFMVCLVYGIDCA